MLTVPPCCCSCPQASTEEKAKKVHSASLTLRSALWEYCWDAGWIVFCFSLFFFLTAQASRQVGDAQPWPAGPFSNLCFGSPRLAAASSLLSP